MNTLDRARPYFAQLEKRALTLKKLAEVLKCNVCYLSRLVSPHLQRVESGHKLRQKRSKLHESRKEMRKRHAVLVKLKQKSLKKGAADAKCSERTLRRYVSKV